MKRIWNCIKLGFQVAKCLSCAHKCECKYSMFIVHENVKYLLTAEKAKEDK